jgi:putative heme-binding domain-containing protein
MWAVWLLVFQAVNPHTTLRDVDEGREVFRLRCAECHGAAGEGGRAPNLANGVFYHGGTDTDLYRTIEGGIPGTEMPGFSASELRLWQLVAFLRSLNTAADPSQLPGDAVRGEELVREKGGCLACHRLGREGGFAGPDLSAVGSRRSLDYLMTSLVDPNRDVRPRYRVATITDASGVPVQGFLLDEDRHTVQLLDFDGKLRSLKRETFTRLEVDPSSIMQSYEDVFDEREMDDVVSFLATLRGGSR